MSNVNKLFHEILSDAEARTEIIKASDSIMFMAAVMSEAEKRDLPVTFTEVDEFIRSNPPIELSDDDLELIVGGKAGVSDDQNIQGDNFLGFGWLTGNYDDTLEGGSGNDTLSGGKGDDELIGGAGDDSLVGGEGDDVLLAKDGDDTLEGGWGDDELFGNAGNDSMLGGDGKDKMYGGYGDDTMHAGDDDDGGYMAGEFGNDSMTGSGGEDTMSGGSGNDTLHGGSGNDLLSGDHGNDVIDGGTGDDELRGGVGSDLFVFGNGDGMDKVTDFEVNSDKLLFKGATQGDLNIGVVGGNTIISFGDTQVTLEGVTMTADQVWAHVITEMPE